MHAAFGEAMMLPVPPGQEASGQAAPGGNDPALLGCVILVHAAALAVTLLLVAQTVMSLADDGSAHSRLATAPAAKVGVCRAPGASRAGDGRLASVVDVLRLLP